MFNKFTTLKYQNAVGDLKPKKPCAANRQTNPLWTQFNATGFRKQAKNTRHTFCDANNKKSFNQPSKKSEDLRELLTNCTYKLWHSPSKTDMHRMETAMDAILLPRVFVRKVVN